MKPLEFSGLYALHPEEPTAIPVTAAWLATWPDNGRTGVYFVFGSEMQLLYIGKAKDFGWRLSQHFKWSAGRGSVCQAQGTWNMRPAFVMTVAVTEEHEASGMEAYLIAELDPSENFHHRRSPLALT